MKIRFIYSEKSENIEDMSRDRVHLNLSYGEWRKLRDLIDCALFDSRTNSILERRAKNIHRMFENAQSLEPIWTKD